ncbi:hypothetical protein ABZ404_37240 [Streptomyces sp. NPDC005878]|uniref:hypothetical protein n=1 Tax=Streptomyces sp. NPDC005878 TaxID=3157077 RepID=UPI0033FB614F
MATAIEAPASSTAEGPLQHTQNQLKGLAVLRGDFPDSQIQHLPKIWCSDCSRSRAKVCENPRHAKAKCEECGNYITTAHVDLDYVGHAELTHRLLDADPLWDWEPVAFDPHGLPAFDQNGGLWIRLTVCGHTRLGYGDAQGKSGPNAVKEAIGDALRNAAMRFGAALNLWAKSDLREAQNEHPKTADDEGRSSTGRPDPAQAAPAASTADLHRLMAQIANCWDNPLSLLQIRIEGKQLGLSERRVQGPPPESIWTTFDTLLDTRITELKPSTNQNVDADGSAA